MQIGVAIRGARQAAGLTQVGLAASAGVSVSIVRQLEGGWRTNCTIETLRRIAAALDVSVSDLVEGGAA